MTASIAPASRPALITGGAGFIGCNLAQRLVRSGTPVLILDNLSRPGVQRNLDLLQAKYPGKVEVVIGDVRSRQEVRAAVRRASAVYHFAAQVAVTTSLVEPRHDFEVNAHGTLNVLEALRELPKPPPLLYTSTNKVYGSVSDVRLDELAQRFVPVHPGVAARGIDEARPLDFHSPYGCSKGCADQYVRDYARSFGLPTVVFRMSCIYGRHQFGNEDQGWVAHFLIRALSGRPITLFGDGKQVRDVLYVDDLTRAMVAASERADVLAGNAFNVGGGAQHTLSLLELIDMIRDITGERCQVDFEGARVGDQRYYVSDVSKLTQATGWEPTTSVEEGVQKLARWVREQHVGGALGGDGLAVREREQAAL
jgi:CDP-paratose 2-epimerase